MTEEDASNRMRLRPYFAVVSSKKKKKKNIIVFDSFFSRCLFKIKS